MTAAWKQLESRTRQHSGCLFTTSTQGLVLEARGKALVNTRAILTGEGGPFSPESWMVKKPNKNYRVHMKSLTCYESAAHCVLQRQ